MKNVFVSAGPPACRRRFGPWSCGNSLENKFGFSLAVCIFKRNCHRGGEEDFVEQKT